MFFFSYFQCLGEGKWGRKKSRRIPTREGDWQGRVPKCSLPPSNLFKTRDLELPISEASLPSCLPHSAGHTRTSVHPYFPVAKMWGRALGGTFEFFRGISQLWLLDPCNWLVALQSQSAICSAWLLVLNLSCSKGLSRLPSSRCDVDDLLDPICSQPLHAQGLRVPTTVCSERTSVTHKDRDSGAEQGVTFFSNRFPSIKDSLTLHDL